MLPTVESCACVNQNVREWFCFATSMETCNNLSFDEIANVYTRGKNTVIINICNCRGVWRRKGLSGALRARYGSKLLEEYRNKCQRILDDHRLGMVIAVQVDESNLYVSNILARTGAMNMLGYDPFDYRALERGLKTVFGTSDTFRKPTLRIAKETGAV